MLFTHNNFKKKLRYRLIGLRGKLLLATLVLFILPVAGLSYLKELELFLKNNHSESVLVIAKTISSVFRDNSSLTALNRLTQSNQTAIYCHSLINEKTIDGFSNDWFELQNQQEYFYPELKNAVSSTKNLSLLCANDEQYYYFLLSVNKISTQKNITFGQVDFIKSKRNNSINFQYLDYGRKLQEYHFLLDTPGWVKGQLTSTLSRESKKQIQAQWQENKQGLTFEFKIPIARINHYMAFNLQQINDPNDEKTAKTPTLISTANHNGLLITDKQLNPIIQTDPLSMIKLEQLVPPNTRLWLLNKHQYISAQAGQAFPSKQIKQDEFSLLAMYRQLYLIIMNYPEQQSFYGSHQSQIHNNAIKLTLKGQSTAEWLDSPHNNKMVLSVTTPVYDNEKNIIGTLVLEQKNETLLALQDKAFERILFLSVILFFSVILTLLFLSTRLLKRIINLRDDTNLALSNDGVISNQLYRNDNDEIGDLARSFSTLLSRIDQNNQYLRSLASKLSHELRTPLTVIRSSLENMDTLDLSKDNLKYTLRANEGCTRMSNLLNRMSEASRLEQSINSIEKENIEIVSFLNNYIDSIRLANVPIDIQFETNISKLSLKISPELIAQLLDKLLSNAISFHKKKTPITLRAMIDKDAMVIEVHNYGELIDSNKLESIFSSLTSYRTKNTQNVHLGLGLYICSLISQFHNGEINAFNHNTSQSVSIFFKIPITSNE